MVIFETRYKANKEKKNSQWYSKTVWNMEEAEMKIEVRIDGMLMFSGLAEDYLFMNDNDTELELLLDELERMDYNSVVRLENREIEKLVDVLWED